MKYPSAYLKFGLITLFAVIIIGYAGFQARNLINGPVIIIQYPERNSPINTSLINIRGTAKNISYIEMNGRQIFVDESGAFSEKLLLSYGYNIITLRAEDKFGREREEVLELIYK